MTWNLEQVESAQVAACVQPKLDELARAGGKLLDRTATIGPDGSLELIYHVLMPDDMVRIYYQMAGLDQQ